VSSPHFKSNGVLNCATEKLPSAAPAKGPPTRVETQHTTEGLQGAAVDEAVREGVTEPLRVAEGVAEPLRVADGVTVDEPVALAVLLAVGVKDAVSLTVGVKLGVAVLLGVPDGVAGLLGVPDAEGPKGHTSARKTLLLLSLMIMAPSVARTITPFG
jgi:hypothetical protein